MTFLTELLNRCQELLMGKIISNILVLRNNIGVRQLGAIAHASRSRVRLSSGLSS